MNRFKFMTLFFLFSLFCGCASLKSHIDDEDENKIYRGYTEKQLFDNATTSMKQARYAEAIKRLEALEAIYPFSTYSESALLRMIYSHYKKGDTTAAAATADRFIHLYPRAKHVDYAYYLRGVADFEQQRGVLTNMFHVDPSWRAAGTQQQAYLDFMQLAKRFPQSPYTPDAIKRMVYLRNMFAKKELNIANYYMKRKMYIAARNRAAYLVKEFSQSPQVESALAILVKVNNKLGLVDAANAAKKVLLASYPNTERLV